MACPPSQEPGSHWTIGIDPKQPVGTWTVTFNLTGTDSSYMNVPRGRKV
ncbi:unnamed protein product [Penicillium roqueforti FM164]|uniref:Genomic scaffold, ProqFM164S01 n=1 Tax=Penicillium roqueforti (strain FM164) TaxID=1365484 RepID=W6PVQ8_PENRF|nr:unnamed protein product [Penicillium roqueforti FM164]